MLITQQMWLDVLHRIHILELAHDRNEIMAALHEISAKLDTVSNKEIYIVAKLDELQANVAAEDSAIDSAIVLINGLAAQIAALPADQAAIDALAADVKARGDALAAAVVANTPAAKAEGFAETTTSKAKK